MLTGNLRYRGNQTTPDKISSNAKIEHRNNLTENITIWYFDN